MPIDCHLLRARSAGFILRAWRYLTVKLRQRGAAPGLVPRRADPHIQSEICFRVAFAASLFGMIMCGLHGASAAVRQ
ncbi:hypothetical protein B1987_04050 [Mycobacterium kansasii]|nr:hypothetical protein B1987_04050 [Mycobacterium kansasii]